MYVFKHKKTIFQTLLHYEIQFLDFTMPSLLVSAIGEVLMSYTGSIDSFNKMTGKGNKLKTRSGRQKLQQRHWVVGAYDCLQIREGHGWPLTCSHQSVLSRQFQDNSENHPALVLQSTWTPELNCFRKLSTTIRSQTRRTVMEIRRANNMSQ